MIIYIYFSIILGKAYITYPTRLFKGTKPDQNNRKKSLFRTFLSLKTSILTVFCKN